MQPKQGALHICQPGGSPGYSATEAAVCPILVTYVAYASCVRRGVDNRTRLRYDCTRKGYIMIGTTRAFSLFCKARTTVLSILFCHSDKQFYVRQIMRAAGMGHGIIQRELAALAGAGLIIREQHGNQTLYRANSASPIFGELRGIMMKTAGLADILRASLAPLSDRITSAFVYGSLARGNERTDSDVNIMVVGYVTLGQIVEALHSAELGAGQGGKSTGLLARGFLREVGRE